ncbi:MAG TPA: 1,2-phenylacetyl-CoA epoxidase subunit PaaC [Bryobacteraceae bacterium]|nr:1,2-phenylacetyl-CoA epoxidase subunit PaaC [Bryobacteraceae bacterium]
MSLPEYLLRLGDNALILSQRLGEWCGHGPVLEEDIALTNVALDLLGQARLWLGYAGELTGRDEDQIAFLRDAGEFRNVLLVEQPNGDFAHTMARQFFFDLWHRLLLEKLSASKDERIGGIAAKALKEVAYHRRRSTDWILRLGDGTEESHARMQQAADDLWMYTGELFEMDALDKEMQQAGIGCDLAALREPWLNEVSRVFREGTLEVPKQSWMQRGGKRGIHSENLGHILAEMQFLQRAYPGAKW